MGGNFAKKFFYILLFVFLSLSVDLSLVSAGQISIRNEFSISEGMMQISTYNSGDEEAYGLYHEVGEIKGVVHEIVGDSVSDSFAVAKELIFVNTRYSDRSGRGYSVLSVLNNGKTDESISITADNIRLSSRKSFSVSVSNLGDLKKDIRLYIISGDDISYQKNPVYISLDPLGSKKASFVIDKGSALDGSVYNLYIVAETSDGSAYTSVPVKIERKSLLLPIIFLSLLLIAGFFIRKAFGTIFTDIAVFAAIFFFILLFISPADIFSLTTTTGGDTASHYPIAEFMKDSLLPEGKLTGWYPGSYAGFPALTFYFPIPFLIISLLGYLIPLQIAFKIGTLLGTFLLPISVYIFLRCLKSRFPIPILGAVASLSFLFMEANSMWGGNIPSTFAGEFSYSLGLSLAIIFLGTSYEGFTKGKWTFLNSILLALIGLSHVYTLLFAGLSSLFFIFEGWVRDSSIKKQLDYFMRIYLLSFMLIAFWLIPLFLKLSFTTSYADVWEVSVTKFFPMIIIPFILLIAIWLFFFGYRSTVRQDSRPYYFLFSLSVATLLFLSAKNIGVVNIRFVPFIQLMLIIFGVFSFGYLIHGLKERYMYLIMILFVCFTFLYVYSDVSYIDDWSRWNYGGFEEKSWDKYSEINGYLSSSGRDSRVVFEHSSKHNQFGTVRAFESLYFFSGRPNTEGLYMQSSLSAPASFYLQSLTSKERSCPFPNFGCSTLDYSRAYDRLRMFNVGEIIIVSDEARDSAESDGRYILEKNISEYSIYSLEERGYIYVPDIRPVPFDSDNPSEISYLWFIDDELSKIPIYFDDIGLTSLDDLVKDDISYLNTECVIDEVISDDTIEFNTNCVGMPHMISISYFPNWKAVKGADELYRAAPSLMMVIPQEGHVKIHYSRTIDQKVGLIITIIGICLLFIPRHIGTKSKRKGIKWLLGHMNRSIDFIFDKIDRHKTILLLVFIILAFALIIFHDDREGDNFTMQIAQKSGSYIVCEHAGKYREECFIKVAADTKDFNLCPARARDTDRCYLEVAKILGDETLCERIGKKAVESECRASV